MKVNVLFFGITHDLTGCAQEQVDLPEGETLEGLRRHYESRFPRLRQWGARFCLRSIRKSPKGPPSCATVMRWRSCLP